MLCPIVVVGYRMLPFDGCRWLPDDALFDGCRWLPGGALFDGCHWLLDDALFDGCRWLLDDALFDGCHWLPDDALFDGCHWLPDDALFDGCLVYCRHVEPLLLLFVKCLCRVAVVRLEFGQLHLWHGDVVARELVVLPRVIDEVHQSALPGQLTVHGGGHGWPLCSQRGLVPGVKKKSCNVFILPSVEKKTMSKYVC